MALELGPETEVTRDEDGRVIEIDHSNRPIDLLDELVGRASHREVARRYLVEAADVLGLDPEIVAPTERRYRPSLVDEGTRLRFRREKEIAGLAVVEFVETHRGPPVWNTAAGVRLDPHPRRRGRASARSRRRPVRSRSGHAGEPGRAPRARRLRR